MSDPRYDGLARIRMREAYGRRLERLAEPAAHPAPAVPLRDVASRDEMPPGGMTLARDATAHGWRGRATYAQGTEMHANGRPGGIVESVAVRMERGSEHAVAVWRRCAEGAGAGKWMTDGAWYWMDGQWPRKIGVTSVRNMVKSDYKSTGVSGHRSGNPERSA